MAKNQTTQATNASGNLINQAQGLTAPIITGLGSASTTASGNQAGELASATGGISSAQSTGGYDPTQLGTLRANTANLAATGGYDPTQTASLNSGGYDPTSLATLNSGYTNMATTGGYTPQQANQFIQQATEGTTDTGQILQSQAKQALAKTGGEGSAGAIAQMSRQLGQSQASNTLNAEVALNSQENANKLSGLQGLGTTASSVAGNTLQGEEALAAGKSGGVAQQAGLESNVASGVNTANSQMSQLYNTTTGQVTAIGQQVLSALGLDFSTQASATQSLATLSKNPGALQTVLGTLGLGGGAGGSAI